MSESLRIAPEEPFPEDLESVSNQDLQVLNSKVYRQLDHEAVYEGEPQPETEFRHEEVASELNNRDSDANA